MPPCFHNQKDGWVQDCPDPDVTGAGEQGATGGASVGRAVTAETMSVPVKGSKVCGLQGTSLCACVLGVHQHPLPAV